MKALAAPSRARPAATLAGAVARQSASSLMTSCASGAGLGTLAGYVVHAGNATSTEQLQAFYDAALANGGVDNGAPGPRPDYGEPYYGCFVKDPDGHKLEATFWDASKE